MPDRTCSVDGCGRPHRARGYCSTCYNQRQPDRHRPKAATCCVCGKPTTTRSGTSDDRKVCSYDCRWFLQYGGASCPIPETHPAHPRWAGRLLPVLWTPPAPPAPPVRRWVAGTCHRCGSAYVAEDYSGTARYCSRHCYKAATRQAWKERTDRIVPAEVRAYVYERDRWICWLCSRPIRRDAEAPHPLSHSVDHVVPQSEGGKHEAANLRAAHLLCNALRGARGGGEQLALI